MITHTHDYDKKINDLWFVSSQVDTKFFQLNPPGNPLTAVAISMEISCQLCHLHSEVRCYCNTYESKYLPQIPLPFGWEWRGGKVLCRACKEVKQ